MKSELPGNRRVTGSEQYYTPASTADQLVDVVGGLLSVDSINPWQHHFIEPAGGTGAFVSALQRRGVSKIHAVDIEPHHPLVNQGDFLAWHPEVQGAVTISNPPFGRNNKLSVRFFNHAADFSQLIAFVVPRSWRKWSVINRLDPRFELVSDTDLQVSYVDLDGRPLSIHNHLRTAFQVWQLAAEPRAKLLVRDMGWVEKTSFEQATHSLTSFGYGCGRVSTDLSAGQKSTDIYLRVKNQSVADALPLLDYRKFSVHTAYTAAISLPELNYLLNEYLTGDAGLEKVGWEKR